MTSFPSGWNEAAWLSAMQTDAASLSALDQQGSSWNRLALASPLPDPFCATTAWQLSWREAAGSSLPVLVRECSDGLVQFALYRMGAEPVLAPLEGHWLFGCNVLGPAGVDLLEEILREEMIGSGRPVPRMIISGLDPAGDCLRAIRARLSGRLPVRGISREVQCAASLDGGLDGFLSRRSANHRRKLQQTHRRAASAGLVVEPCAPLGEEDAAKVFSRMLDIEARSWKGLAGRGMNSPSVSGFYEAMLRRLSASGSARVMFAVHDGEDIGFIFGGLSGDIYRGQQFSFDEAWRSLSPGNLMQYEQIAALCAEGVRRYDMGPLTGPSMAYKHRWAELRMPMEAYLLG